MAEFGKRNTAGRAPAARTSSSSSEAPDLAGAIKAVKTGELPKWTKGGPAYLFFIMFVALAGFGFIGHLYGGDLLRDLRLSGTWQPAYELQAADGRCTRHNFIGTDCSAKITSVAEPDKPPVDVGFLMLFTSGGGEVLMPVRSTSDPAAVTIAYAAETELMNRMVTFLLMELMCVCAFMAGLSGFMKGRYEGGAAHRALLAGFAELQARVGEPKPGVPA